MTAKKGTAGRPSMGVHISMALRVSPNWADAVDAWAARQKDKPKRSEAVRELVERGLQAEGVAVAPPGLPYQDLTVDGRSATMMQFGRVDVTVFADGEVRVVQRARRAR
jgi:hypothetical protein